MRVRLKGLNSITKKLADGKRRTYWYAWKGGPPLRGKPGTPEFIHSYNEAIATKAATPEGRLLSVLQAYQASGEFNGLAARTRRDYIEKIKVIEAEFGDFPAVGADRPAHPRHLHGVARQARSQVTAAGGLCVAVFARVLSWGLNRGLVLANPCARGGRLYRGSRRRQHLDRGRRGGFLKSAPAYFHLPLLLALWTGQRQGDLLAPAVVGL